MDLRNKLPIQTFQHLVNKEGNFLYDGTGSLVTNANLTSSWSTASFTSSYIYPSSGVVSFMNNATGSAGSSGFASTAEAVAFMVAVSSSLITLNTLITRLRSKGIIT